LTRIRVELEVARRVADEVAAVRPVGAVVLGRRPGDMEGPAGVDEAAGVCGRVRDGAGEAGAERHVGPDDRFLLVERPHGRRGRGRSGEEEQHQYGQWKKQLKLCSMVWLCGSLHLLLLFVVFL